MRTVALIAKHVLSGENWPVFFYRQSFMGSLNGTAWCRRSTSSVPPSCSYG